MKKSFLLLFAGLFAATAMAELQPGQTAPNFSLTDTQGQKHSLSDYRGKYVVLEWNNPQCPFVRAQYDSGNIPKLQQEERGKGVVWLTINSASGDRQPDTSAIQKFLADQHAAPTAYLRDPDATAGHLYSAKTTPDMYVIDPDGKLVYEGAIDSNATTDSSEVASATNYVRAALDASMSGKPVAQAITKPYGCHVQY